MLVEWSLITIGILLIVYCYNTSAWCGDKATKPNLELIYCIGVARVWGISMNGKLLE